MLEIKVLGPGCPNCIKLEKLCREVVDEDKIEAIELGKMIKQRPVDDINKHAEKLINDQL